jgi:hypothetical protein
MLDLVLLFFVNLPRAAPVAVRVLLAHGHARDPKELGDITDDEQHKPSVCNGRNAECRPDEEGGPLRCRLENGWPEHFRSGKIRISCRNGVPVQEQRQCKVCSSRNAYKCHGIEHREGCFGDMGENHPANGMGKLKTPGASERQECSAIKDARSLRLLRKPKPERILSAEGDEGQETDKGSNGRLLRRLLGAENVAIAR